MTFFHRRDDLRDSCWYWELTRVRNPEEIRRLDWEFPRWNPRSVGMESDGTVKNRSECRDQASGLPFVALESEKQYGEKRDACLGD